MFLDEIGEMSPKLQAKLLQVLQDGEFSRLGGDVDVHVDVRVLAATNRNLEDMVRKGDVPRGPVLPAERRERLRAAAARAPARRSPSWSTTSCSCTAPSTAASWTAISDRLMRGFLDYRWPGNVRELENMVKRIVVLQSEDAIADEIFGAPAAAAQRLPARAERGGAAAARAATPEPQSRCATSAAGPPATPSARPSSGCSTRPTGTARRPPGSWRSRTRPCSRRSRSAAWASDAADAAILALAQSRALPVICSPSSHRPPSAGRPRPLSGRLARLWHDARPSRPRRECRGGCCASRPSERAQRLRTRVNRMAARDVRNEAGVSLGDLYGVVRRRVRGSWSPRLAAWSSSLGPRAHAAGRVRGGPRRSPSSRRSSRTSSRPTPIAAETETRYENLKLQLLARDSLSSIITDFKLFEGATTRARGAGRGDAQAITIEPLPPAIVDPRKPSS